MTQDHLEVSATGTLRICAINGATAQDLETEMSAARVPISESE